MASKKWIVVAEQSRARLFLMESPTAALKELRVLTHPEGRAAPHDLQTDRDAQVVRGRHRESHAIEAHVDPKRQEAMAFAREIVAVLETGRLEAAYEALILVAAPEYLGILRENLSEPLKKLVSNSLAKNLVRHSEADIREHVLAL
jgi:protein required for attachment to host cells